MPGSTQSSSLLAPTAADALALFAELPDFTGGGFSTPWPGTIVTVDPSGIVVVPARPLGLEVMLLDILPDRALMSRATRVACSCLAAVVDECDDALADVALEDAPCATAQDRLV